jgi:HEAT repeat protein
VGVGNEEVINVLLEELYDGNSPESEWSVDTKGSVRVRIAEILGKVGMSCEVVNMLLEELHDADDKVRLNAVEILFDIGEKNEEVVSVLLEMLHDADDKVRRRAAEILGQIGEENEEVVSVLLEMLHDADGLGFSPVIAAGILCQIGKSNEKVVSMLLEELRHHADSCVKSFLLKAERLKR